MNENGKPGAALQRERLGKKRRKARGVLPVRGILRKRLVNDSGQSTVEAAFMLPIAFVLVLLLVQPGILLYDRMVMQGAAAEGCRLLATTQDAESEEGAEQCRAYIRRSLGAVPQQDCFHVHDGGCTWNIELEGDESSQVVRVSIETEVKPLPLFDAGAVLLGIANERGNVVVKVAETYQVQPDWIGGVSAGRDPAAWVGAWLDE